MGRFEPRRILCPIDFSEHSAQALRLAGALARAFDADIIVLHAQRLEVPAYFTEAQITALKGHLRRSARAAKALTEKFSDQYLPAEQSRTVNIVEAAPVTAIFAALKESKAGLLVMGTHGRSGFSRIRMGSVTESVLRQSSIPVATAGPQVRSAASVEAIHRVLAAVDYSETSRTVLEDAAAVASRTGAELVVAHVAPASSGSRDETSLRASLCEWVEPEVRSRCQVSEELRKGNVAEEILNAAKQRRVNLIVAGMVRRRLLGSVHLGRVSEAIVRAAPAAVLMVPG